MKENTFICTCCHVEYPLTQCHKKTEKPFVSLSGGGNRIVQFLRRTNLSDNNAGNCDTPLCQRCYDRSYTTCDRCGRNPLL